ncbi:hypothetical protein DCS_00628 [Drechmeria coniospora]|uniref:Cyclin N-terminal domain-containing protein n=1 Tax=Drechmeria coniospora TaxID=98403 RepID=A0A151GR09_DRECN|nr:hypothetical protein DCS_00628 [Drechmeria coniospora]KYK59498.1 hypothetical protein DCS_00628 [Drechmeria coniospora]ODA76259.1 hypothetical protein RJ55_08104 [Drechmeria coniospora]
MTATMYRERKPVVVAGRDGVDDDYECLEYLTYRPLSNLPTPPPSWRDASSASQSPSCLEAGEQLHPKFRGPAIHLVNLIPSSASLAVASVPLVQAMLTRADLPLDVVALAVCVLDSLDAKFARAWRLSCPVVPGETASTDAETDSSTTTSAEKHPRPFQTHTPPPTPPLYQAAQRQMLHIDSVKPELIILAALVIAVKFTQDPQQTTQRYCSDWGRSSWSADQLNVTERCIMESLDYRIMPLCEEDCLTDAMVDMQLAGQQGDSFARQPSPPDSVGIDE